MSFTSRVASIFQGQREGIPAGVGKDPRDLTQKAKLDKLPNTVLNILINDQINTADTFRAAREFIDYHGLTSKGYLKIDSDKYNDDVLRNIAAIILINFDNGNPNKEFLRDQLHLTPERAKELVLVILYALSLDRPSFQAFVNNNIQRLQAIYPGFFDTESAM